MYTATRAVLLAATTLSTLVLEGCGQDVTQVSRANFEAGLRSFLAEGNDQVCLGLYDWPIDLTEAEAGAHSRHAVQLPVFERLGLVRSTVIPVPVSSVNPDGAIKRYALTDEGSKYYRAHAHTGADRAVHANDLCVARITLARVESWEVTAGDTHPSSATVSYTYHIEPAPWMQDADAQRVLPLVAQVIKGADGSMRMRQGFTLGPQGWVAVPGAV